MCVKIEAQTVILVIKISDKLSQTTALTVENDHHSFQYKFQTVHPQLSYFWWFLFLPLYTVHGPTAPVSSLCSKPQSTGRY
jgi:hypothetical protein